MPAAITEGLRAMSTSDRLALDGGPPLLTSSLVARWPTDPFDNHLGVTRPPKHGVRQKLGRLERRWRDTTGAVHVVACPSVAVALNLALNALEVQAGDEVIGPIDAGLVATLAAGSIEATPVFVDLDPETLHLDPSLVVEAVSERTKAIIALDKHGSTADFNALKAVADNHRIPIIEECSAAIGATYDHRPAGSLGTVGICSLDGSAASSTIGNLGLLATADEDVAARLRRIELVDDHLPLLAPGPGGGVAGWTSQITELDAALADRHLQRLKSGADRRRRNGDYLRRLLEGMPGLLLPQRSPGATQVYADFPIIVLPEEIGLGDRTAPHLRNTIIECATAEGLWVDRWTPTSGRSGFPVAELVWSSGLIIGAHHSPLRASDPVEAMGRIADCLAKIVVDNVDRIRQLTLARMELIETVSDDDLSPGGA